MVSLLKWLTNSPRVLHNIFGVTHSKQGLVCTVTKTSGFCLRSRVLSSRVCSQKIPSTFYSKYFFDTCLKLKKTVVLFEYD